MLKRALNPNLLLFPMKTLPLLLSSLVALTGSVFAQDRPSGWISADSQFVRAGTFPRITWGIDFPVAQTENEDSFDGVEISEDGDIEPVRDLKMDVRVLAADVQRRTTRGSSRTGYYFEFEHINVAALGRVNSTGWATLFNGTQPQVNPSNVVWTRHLEEGDSIEFASRVLLDGFGWYVSGRGSSNVVVLRNGDVPPVFSTWDTQSTLGTHIEAYLDDDGKVDVGFRDLIVAFELTHVIDPSRGSDQDGDMQDMVLLLSFEED